ncbi:MAG: ATP-dependent zinc metalloprotease FtsH [Gemmatimonadota bacterium]
MHPRHRFALWYAVLALFAFTALQSLLGRHRETIPYSEFRTLVRAGKVTSALIEDRRISGILSTEGIDSLLPAERVGAISSGSGTEHAFVTARMEDPELVELLDAGGVRYARRASNPWASALLGWILPFGLIFGVWMLLSRRMSAHSGMMSVGRSKAKVYTEERTGITFDDVAGVDEARAELAEIVDFLKRPDRYVRLGGTIPRGALLAGPPGTGKTLLAKAVAGEAGVPFFSLTGSDFVEMFVGVGAARVRDLFRQAQEKAPSIIFIDELDALGKARGTTPGIGGHDEREQTLNQLLAEMDGFDSRAGLIVVAATNRPEILDPALLRPGRFDRKIVVDRPDLLGRAAILRLHARGVKLAGAVDLDAVAARTPGFVGADLANLVNEAALLAARAGKEAVEPADLDEAVDRVVSGLERRSRVLSPREKGIVAYHEAGHALVAASRERADPVAKVSIIPRGIAALGYTQQQPLEDRFLMTREEILARIDVLLGGRVAEELALGDVSTGAADDLRRATELARHMVTEFGMGSALGLVAYPRASQATFLEMPGVVGPPPYGADTAGRVDEEVRHTLDEAHARVTGSLRSLRGALEDLARRLMEQEVVDGETVRGLVVANPVHDEAAERDPVCGMRLPAPTPPLSVRRGGRQYHFCSAECRDAFDRDPDRFTIR